MEHACRPLTAWRRAALATRAASALVLCAGVLLYTSDAAAQVCGDPAFGTSPGVNLPEAPRGVAKGDFNMDGAEDAVVVTATGQLRFLRGNGTGALFAQPPIGTVSDPRDVVAGDFNRDGRLDLAVAAAGTTGVELFAGNGAGGFTAQTPFAVAVVPSRLATADMDRDGRSDILVVNDAGLVILLLASGDFTFTRFPSDFTVSSPAGVAVGDFDENGWLDLAVAEGPANQVEVFQASANVTPPPAVVYAAGAVVAVTNPVDVATGDVDRDGDLDLVTVDDATGLAHVILGDGLGGFALDPTAIPVGAGVTRVALTDWDRDGFVDLVALASGAGSPQVVVVPGTGGTSPFFDDARKGTLDLTAASTPVGLAIGDWKRDGRPDALAVTTLTGAHAAVVGTNATGPDCTLSSFADAPRAFAAGDAPVGTAAADFDEDGIVDLVVAASGTPSTLEILRGTGGGLYVPLSTTMVTAAPPRGVAVADFDKDGHQDVIAALGSATVGDIQLFRGNGLGGLTPGTLLPTGFNASAVVAGDFDADGRTDVAVTTENANQVQIFLGNGAGAFFAPTTIGVGAGPRALAAGDVDANGTLDLVVADSGGSTVRVLLGAGDGATFNLGPGSPLAVGAGPWGVALGNLNADTIPDIVTANHNAVPGTLSVLLGTGGGAFTPGPTPTLNPDGFPFAVTALELTGDTSVDLAAVTGNHTLNLFAGNGAGGFPTPATVVPVRTRPSAVVPVDADADGHADLAVPCRDADSLVVLLARPSGGLREAVRFPVGAKPVGAATADLDGDGDLDLAVVNEDDGSVTILTWDSGTFSTHATLPVGTAPRAVVAADLDRDGVVDLAVSNSGSGTVSVLRGVGGANFTLLGTPSAGSAPEDVEAGDFDRDGDLDLAVANKLATGRVTILVNNGAGGFAAGATPTVGNTPIGLAVADLDRNGTLDIAVANSGTPNVVTVLPGNGAGLFGTPLNLPLHASDLQAVSVAAVDLDQDGWLDLVAAAFSTSGINVFENTSVSPSLSFGPATRYPASYLPMLVAPADVNRDGKPDLVMAADGAKVVRGQGTLIPAPAEDMVAGRGPSAIVVGDFDGDGRLDLAVPNSLSNDVSILFSTSCSARRLAVAASPEACVLGAPLDVFATVEARDDGGNLAACASGTVVPSIVPGTGSLGAVLNPPGGVALSGGQAAFGPLNVSLPGPRYRLAFDLAGLEPAVTRSFTLGPTLSIVGPMSVCPVAPMSHSVDPGYDSYKWTTSGTPYGFTDTVTLTSPPLTLDTTYLLGVEARIDGCLVTDSLSVHLGDLSSVSVAVSGSTLVCVDCIGGTATATETGGGAVVARQWGYRQTSGGTITLLAGQTGPSYVVNGLDFPGPGTYYLVETTQATCGSPVTSNEVTVTVEATVPGGEVRSLGVTSLDFGGRGRNILQWVNTSGSLEEIRIRWNQATVGTSFCVPPSSPTSGAFDGEVVIPSPGPLMKGTYVHDNLDFDTGYCYSVFSKASGAYSAGRSVKGYPFDTTASPEKWAYYTGATAVVPPVVTFPGLLAMSNDQSVHSVGRGLLGGTWPLSFTPRWLTGVAHSRSPVVPFNPPLATADTVLFVGDDAGDVVAVDAATGTAVWGPVTPFTPPLGASIIGAPGGTFVQYFAAQDAIVVGIRNNDAAQAGRFVALRLSDGSLADSFDGVGTPGVGLGPMSSTPALNPFTGLVFFTSRKLTGGAHSVWCLQLSPGPTLTYLWSRDFGDIDASPVVRNGRLYVANTAGGIYSINTANPDDFRSYTNPDGAPHGFLFPNRDTDELIYASSSSVRSISDTSGGFVENWAWSPTGLEPSVALFWPQTTYVYVGGQGGTLYQLDFSGGPPSSTCDPWPSPGSSCVSLVIGDGLGHVGAPSLDIGLTPPVEIDPGKAMLYVGEESGGIHGIVVPYN